MEFSAELETWASMGWVRLTVSSLERSVVFYREVLGLRVVSEEEGAVVMGCGGEPLLFLYEARGAGPKPPKTVGLYHFAILLPSRRDLAEFFLRLSERWHVEGASDHLVSEALYLSDPDGHGIEVYSDRPAGRWRFLGDGSIYMATLPLDIESLLREPFDADRVASDSWVAPDGTRLGHIHLHVSRLERARDFYQGALELSITFRWERAGALFFAAGRYHHHIGANVWAGVDAPRPPPDSVALKSYSIVLRDAERLHSLSEMLKDRGHVIEEPVGPVPRGFGGFAVRDLDGNVVEIVASS